MAVRMMLLGSNKSNTSPGLTTCSCFSVVRETSFSASLICSNAWLIPSGFLAPTAAANAVLASANLTCAACTFSARGMGAASSGVAAMPFTGVGGATSAISADGIGASAAVNRSRVCPIFVRNPRNSSRWGSLACNSATTSACLEAASNSPFCSKSRRFFSALSSCFMKSCSDAVTPPRSSIRGAKPSMRLIRSARSASICFCVATSGAAARLVSTVSSLERN